MHACTLNQLSHLQWNLGPPLQSEFVDARFGSFALRIAGWSDMEEEVRVSACQQIRLILRMSS
jgi:hypothetical protein